ncbi:hypothetical protein [Nisaea denitrificans]|uniref:hypothetical protein n=1 Tax=Nisaea denitrificans TaxID=390877 RepID=UPI0012EB26E0|nr:hypothetical protein [Nisaea denitrificans]
MRDVRKKISSFIKIKNLAYLSLLTCLFVSKVVLSGENNKEKTNTEYIDICGDVYSHNRNIFIKTKHGSTEFSKNIFIDSKNIDMSNFFRSKIFLVTMFEDCDYEIIDRAVKIIGKYKKLQEFDTSGGGFSGFSRVFKKREGIVTSYIVRPKYKNRSSLKINLFDGMDYASSFSVRFHMSIGMMILIRGKGGFPFDSEEKFSEFIDFYSNSISDEFKKVE